MPVQPSTKSKILALRIRGMTNREISFLLRVTTQNVHKHLRPYEDLADELLGVKKAGRARA